MKVCTRAPVLHHPRSHPLQPRSRAPPPHPSILLPSSHVECRSLSSSGVPQNELPITVILWCVYPPLPSTWQNAPHPCLQLCSSFKSTPTPALAPHSSLEHSPACVSSTGLRTPCTAPTHPYRKDNEDMDDMSDASHSMCPHRTSRSTRILH
ncbi:hypothetical protein BC827DRAFT_266602 [Russula dissimulans]|nr:hypothetical protein BC827DRAFT_266602 [Russula dissimulans]